MMKKRVFIFLLFMLMFILSFDVEMIRAAAFNKQVNNDLTAEDYEEMGVPADSRLSPRLVDDADLLTPDEEADLLKKLDEVSEKHRNDVVIVTVDSLNGKTATEFADDFFDYHGFGMTEKANGILLLVSMQYRDWAISTTGEGIFAFTDAGQAYMIDQFLPYISKGRYAKGFEKFIDLSDDFLTQYAKGKPYDYGRLPKPPLAWYWLPVTLAAAAFFAWSIVGGMKNNLKSVRRQNAADDYIVRGSFALATEKDLFLNKNLSIVPIPRNSGSSGSSGGGGGSRTHTSSSGRSHGGSSGKF